MYCHTGLISFKNKIILKNNFVKIKFLRFALLCKKTFVWFQSYAN